MKPKGSDGIAGYALTPEDWARNYWTAICRQLEGQERDQIKAGNYDAAEGARIVRAAVETVRHANPSSE